ncbi:Endosomal targeting BRO1-like domain-containing protein, putative isoform 1 [Capsicum annuum]|nr:Endosomal targeting BRO1-like domain-containing protein, putative isoform 1 [Capsicum annuum]
MKKVLESLTERFEEKIYSLEDLKDLTKLSPSELIHALQAQEQRRSLRLEEATETALQAKLKGKIVKKENNQQTQKANVSEVEEQEEFVFTNDGDDVMDDCNDVSNYDDVDYYLSESRCKNDSVPETNLSKELVLLDKDQPQCVNEDHPAYLELKNKGKSFLELLSGGADYCNRNNHERFQEAPVKENGHLELYTFFRMQEPVVLDFTNANAELNMPDFLDPLDEYMGVTVESNEPQMQTQEATGEVNGLLELTASFSQEPAVPENNMPEMFDMGETLLEKKQIQHQPSPQEESETLCETEQSSFDVSYLVKAMLDYTTMEEKLAALRANQSSLISNQQSWHLRRIYHICYCEESILPVQSLLTLWTVLTSLVQFFETLREQLGVTSKHLKEEC